MQHAIRTEVGARRLLRCSDRKDPAAPTFVAIDDRFRLTTVRRRLSSRLQSTSRRTEANSQRVRAALAIDSRSHLGGRNDSDDTGTLTSHADPAYAARA